MKKATGVINVRIDSDDKRRFDEFCASAGLNISVAVNMFVKAVLRENRIPFEITNDPFYSKDNMDRLRRSISVVKSGRASLKEHALIEGD